MQSNRHDFLEMREADCDNIPPVIEQDETKTQAYHNRPRKEGEAVLMDGGYYRVNFEDYYSLIQLKNYNPSSFTLYCNRIVLSHDIDNDLVKVRMKLDSLKDILPAVIEEEEILRRPLQGDFMHKWADSILKSFNKTSKSRVIIEQKKPHTVKPLTDVQKLHYHAEPSEETKTKNIKSIEDGFKKLREKSRGVRSVHES